MAQITAFKRQMALIAFYYLRLHNPLSFENNTIYGLLFKKKQPDRKLSSQKCTRTYEKVLIQNSHTKQKHAQEL